MKRNWNVIHDCDDDETEEATNWASEINHETYGRFVWISKYSDDEYGVEVIPDFEALILAKCKTLASAKRWVSNRFH